MPVHVQYYVDRSAQDGTNDPASGTLECSPIKRRYVNHHVVTPQSFTARLVDGLADLHLDAPGLDWCWQIVERVNRGKRRFVTFTDPGDGSILYADDLIDVDPATFEPDPDPQPGWLGPIEQLESDVSDLESAKQNVATLDADVAGIAADEDSDLHDALTAQILQVGDPRWARKYDISGDVTSTQVQAAIDAKAAGEAVLIGPGTVTVTSQLVINGQLVKTFGTLFKVGDTVSANDISRIVLIAADKSQFIGPATLDGNRTAREAAGKLPTTQSGIQGLDALNVRNTIVAGIWVRDVGCRSDVEPITRTFGAFSCQRTSTATQDVYGNHWRNLHLSDSDRHASFLMRYRTDFDNYSYGQQGYFLRHNSLVGGSCTGTGKNPLEMAGPDTIYNRISDIDISGAGGDAGADFAYGASWNTYERLVIRSVNPLPSITGFSAIECSALDKRAEVPGYTLKYTRGNKIVDCTMRDVAITRDNFFLRGFCDYDGIGNEFIRPRVFDCTVTGTGSDVAGMSFVVMGMTDATEELSQDCRIEEPDFRGVTSGIRVSTARVLRLQVIDPHIEASGDVIRLGTGLVLDRAEIAGGYCQGARFWTPGSTVREHNIHDVQIHTTSTETGLTLSTVAAGGIPGRVVNNRFSTSSTPTVMISRTMPGEIIEGNVFVGVGFSAAGLASSGRGIVRDNIGIGLTAGTHKSSTPACVFVDGAAPTTGSWQVGDVAVNRTPAAASYRGWICTAEGTPGTWEPFGRIGTLTAGDVGAQPADSDLTAIAALATTSFGRGLLTLNDGPALLTAAGAQPLDSDLTAIAALTTTTFGRDLLTKADAASVKTALALVLADVGLSQRPLAEPVVTSLVNLGLRVSGTGFPGRIGYATYVSSVTLTTGSAEFLDCDATAGSILHTLPSTTTAGYVFEAFKNDGTGNTVGLQAPSGGSITGVPGSLTTGTQGTSVKVISTQTAGVFRRRS